jgi:hypothetical protein
VALYVATGAFGLPVWMQIRRPANRPQEAADSDRPYAITLIAQRTSDESTRIIMESCRNRCSSASR